MGAEGILTVDPSRHLAGFQNRGASDFRQRDITDRAAEFGRTNEWLGYNATGDLPQRLATLVAEGDGWADGPKPVNSSWARAYGFYCQAGTSGIAITFKDGVTCWYQGTSGELYRDLINSPSVGKFVHAFLIQLPYTTISAAPGYVRDPMRAYRKPTEQEERSGFVRRPGDAAAERAAEKVAAQNKAAAAMDRYFAR